ncbi:MAG: DUF4019 domain-containing protein [Woeseia sp.]
MRRIGTFAVLLVLAMTLARADNDEAIAIAKEATLSWLSLTDLGNYEESWVRAASNFRAAVSRADWVRSMTAVRAPLGQLNSREIASSSFALTLPGAPDGEYVVLQFNTSFGNKGSAVETVTAMKDDDDTWRVAGYYIK